ncbi:AMP-binding protein [Legionella spiritensis]|uniref:Long-chain-fatty-acid--CoA ligase n=1 Tax=Legionella spiritensis TaxID=452 RepID=A0A0W0YXL0_LEGSP|nr:AMP-binding protein [Legionella spiritensis]KTD61602.1 long chain fatty acid-CoA ligase [Legionella spiritensis]SNV39471.1 long-chain fatty-acid-CoA ligase [Legionella spiritensis]
MDKVWLSQYQKGVPATINADEYASLVSLFEESCKKNAKNTAYVNLGCKLTYEELEQKSRQFAVFLQQLGLKKGARVALMMPNVLQYPVALFGLLRGGFIAVNTNPLYTSDELKHQLNDSGAEVIVVLANFANTVEKVLPHTSLKHVVITEIGDLFPTVKRVIVNAVVRYIKKMVPAYHIPMAVPFNEALKSGHNKPLNTPTLSHQDIAFLQYTGGTTGLAKGAVLTHGNMVSNVLQAYSWICPLHIGSHDTIITALPLYHIFSLTANCLTFMKAGAKNILITNPRDIPHFIKEIKNTQFTAITGVNTLFNALLNNPKFAEVDFSKVKLALSGGMALQKSVSLKWREVTKSRVLEAYGLTETSPAVTINPMYLEEYNGSIGLPLPSTDISVRDESGEEVAPGTPGELCVKGPQVMSGYWQHPDETALVFTKDGYLRTGDIATVDEKGFVYLVDRKKDMIDVSGFNVYPNEVEQVIGMLPGVLEVGVVGEVYEDSGERVKACIVKRDPSLTAEEVIAHCREHLTRYKVPKVVEFYNELPKTNVGKILRRALRKP